MAAQGSPGRTASCPSAQPSAFSAHWPDGPAAGITQLIGNSQKHPQVGVAGRACIVVRASASLDRAAPGNRDGVEGGSSATRSGTPSRMSLESFLNLWASASNRSVRRRSDSLGFLCGLKARVAPGRGVRWRPAVIMGKAGQSTLLGAQPIWLRWFFPTNNPVALEASFLCGPQFPFCPTKE